MTDNKMVTVDEGCVNVLTKRQRCRQQWSVRPFDA